MAAYSHPPRLKISETGQDRPSQKLFGVSKVAHGSFQVRRHRLLLDLRAIIRKHYCTATVRSPALSNRKISSSRFSSQRFLQTAARDTETIMRRTNYTKSLSGPKLLDVPSRSGNFCHFLQQHFASHLTDQTWLQHSGFS